jgi:hypothetical protein
MLLASYVQIAQNLIVFALFFAHVLQSIFCSPIILVINWMVSLGLQELLQDEGGKKIL